MKPIRIFVTGGTFDKEYNELTGHLVFEDTHLPEILEQGRCRLALQIRTLMMIDSLEMNNGDRDLIVSQCLSCPEDKIVITHGTDTMEDTARYLATRVLDKTVVLTGAMIPYKFGSSDGLFNLGGALTAVQILEKGVWVAMNGKIFPAENVKKNRSNGEFEVRV